MLKADHRLPPAATEPFWRPERKAWAVILLAFALFCIFISTAMYTGYRVATAPQTRSVTAQVVQPDAAFLQRSGMLRSEILEDNSQLAVGDKIFTTSATGPAGVAARLRVGRANVALWPATTILVEQGSHGEARLRLEAGQALIDLPEEGESLFVTAAALPQEVELTAPGRYRVRELSDKSTITALAERHLVPGIEVAAGQGRARMGEHVVEAGSRLVTSGTARLEPNHWSLVRDGDFSAYTVDEYRATLYPAAEGSRSKTWIVTREAQSQGANAQSGFFYLRQDCNPSEPKREACHNYVRLARLGGNDKDSTTSIAQEIGADVAAYQRVVLEADVRIDYQSLSKGGADGSECPLFARVNYANAKGENHTQWFCFWAFDHGTGETSAQPYIRSTRIAPKAWYHFKVDLRETNPDLRTIQQLIFYSNGHDYDARIADVSLWAEGLADTLQP